MQALFGPRGACAGCWCMYWRLKRSEFTEKTGEGNRSAMQALIQTGEVPGLLAYLTPEDENVAPMAVGWISIGPRAAFPVLARSRVLKPVDDQPVWSIVCFFVTRSYRRKGLMASLIDAAVEYARQQGAQIVEAYPVEPKQERTSDVFVYTGLVSAFRKAGFEEIARRSETRPIMRKIIS